MGSQSNQVIGDTMQQPYEQNLLKESLKTISGRSVSVIWQSKHLLQDKEQISNIWMITRYSFF